ncbi:MAG: GNAT family N-acetyltransferase [Anaerolineae bacterium]|nr:GNAT family N-acetyltransferase [Anaerolineae bacterium]
MLEGLLVDLVPQDESFFELQHKWRNNDSQFWGSGGDREMTTHAGMQRRRAWWRERMEENSPFRGVYFAMQTKPDAPEPSKPIGFMGINWMNPTHRWGVLGAIIGEPEYWGGGYGTDGVLLLVDYAFEWFDFRKVWLMTTSMNMRVLGQMEKLGFTLEARLRNAALADGEWFDWVYFGLLREEWAGRHALVEQLGLKAK